MIPSYSLIRHYQEKPYTFFEFLNISDIQEHIISVLKKIQSEFTHPDQRLIYTLNDMEININYVSRQSMIEVIKIHIFLNKNNLFSCCIGLTPSNFESFREFVILFGGGRLHTLPVSCEVEEKSNIPSVKILTSMDKLIVLSRLLSNNVNDINSFKEDWPKIYQDPLLRLDYFLRLLRDEKCIKIIFYLVKIIKKLKNNFYVEPLIYEKIEMMRFNAMIGLVINEMKF